MSNQVLFGEAVEILEEKGEWFRVRTLFDNYEGWLTHHLVTEISPETANSKPVYYTSEPVSPIVFGEQIMSIPMGSFLSGYNEDTKQLWEHNILFNSAFRKLGEPLNEEQVMHTAFSLLNSPYLWGGKTCMGIDCSGFVQTVFKVHGIFLQRDAYQQATQGKEIIHLQDALPLDTAFFKNEEGKVIHVGILTGKDSIIHASGKVRIDTLDEQGIINRDTDKRTHWLSGVRRVVGL